MIAAALGVLCSLSGSAFADAGASTLAELQQAIDTRHYVQAEQASQAYLQQHPGNRDARFLHALALAGQGKTDQGIAAFTALAHDYPLRPEPANDLAVLYARKGEYDKARHWLEKALATQPAYETAHRNLGDVYTALADLAYRRALGTQDVAKKLPLTLLDRLYYAGESVAPGPSDPLPKPQPPAGDRVPPAVSAPGPRSAPTSPQQATLPKADDRVDIIQTVRGWAEAWSNQNFDRYIGFYGTHFAPGNGRTREQWRALRKSRLAQPDNIHITLEQLKVTVLDADHVRVDFTQKYDSPRYSDVVSKALFMERENGDWRIVRESTGPDS